MLRASWCFISYRWSEQCSPLIDWCGQCVRLAVRRPDNMAGVAWRCYTRLVIFNFECRCSSQPNCREKFIVMKRTVLSVWAAWFYIGLVGPVLIGSLSTFGEKDFLYQKRTFKNSLSAKFTGCRWETKMAVLGCLEDGRLYQWKEQSEQPTLILLLRANAATQLIHCY